MNCDIKYDPKRDLCEPSQTGYVDLVDLVSHGVIPEGLNVSEESFNNIDDPKAIYGRPQEQFHAMSLAKELNQRGELAEKAAAARASRLKVVNADS